MFRFDMSIPQNMKIHPATYEFENPVTLCVPLGLPGGNAVNKAQQITKVVLWPNIVTIEDETYSLFTLYRGEKMLNMSWLEKDAVAMSLCCLDPDRYMIKSVKKEDIAKNQSEKTKIIFMEEYSENTVMMNMDKLYVCTGDKQDCLLDIKQIKIKVSKIPSIVLKDQYRASIKITSNAGFIHKYYFSSEQNPHIYVAYENDDTDKNKEYYLFIEDCEAVQV